MPCRRRGLDRLRDDVGRRLGQRGEDAAGVEPAHARASPNRCSQSTSPGRAGDAAVWPRSETPTRAAHAEAALGEVEPVADGAADAVVGHPAHQRGVDAALEHEVLDQPADLVVGERGHDRGPQAEAAAQPAGDVVLAAALPGPEGAGGADAPLARVEPQHHLAERDEVEPALVGRPELERAHARSLRAERDRGRGEPRDLREVARREQLRSDHPAAADGEHGRKREVAASVRGARSRRSGRSARRGRAPASARSVATPPSGSAGKNLTVSGRLERGHHLGRGRDAGNHGDAQLPAARDDRGAEAGRDDEPGARVDGRSTCSGREHRAGADEQVRARRRCAAIASAAAAVRNVTSATGRPPAAQRAGRAAAAVSTLARRTTHRHDPARADGSSTPAVLTGRAIRRRRGGRRRDVVGGARGEEDASRRRGPRRRPIGRPGSARGSPAARRDRRAAPGCCRSRCSRGRCALTLTPCAAHSLASALVEPGDRRLRGGVAGDGDARPGS